MSYKIFKNGEWIECAGQPDTTGFATKSETNNCFNTANQTNNKLTLTKANGTSFEYEPEIPSAMTFKGTCLQANLPTSGQQTGDYWKLSDTTGQYVGQCAIWDGTQWSYSSSNIAVDQTVQQGSTNAVSGGAVFTHLQEFYNALHPVGSAHFGITAPVVPNGITATWELIEGIDNRAVWVNNQEEMGSLQPESVIVEGTAITMAQMPAHDHRVYTGAMDTPFTDYAGNHNHTKGSMRIQGSVGPISTDRTPDGTLDTWRALDYSSYDGAGGNHSGGKRVKISIDTNRTDAWTGNTSTDGNHAHALKREGGNQEHTHNVSKIKPARVIIHVWWRVA